MRYEQRFGYRVVQFKLAPFHLISQLDMNRLWDRVLRRAGLPVLFSQGFNPRPLISFAPATPLGVESKAEYLEIFLAECLPEGDICSALNQELPPELRVHKVKKLHPGEKKIAKMIKGFVYSFHFKKIELSFEDILENLPEGVTLCSQIMGQSDQESKLYIFLFEGKSLFLNPFQFIKNSGFDRYEGKLLKVVKEKVLFNDEGVFLD